MANRLIPLIGIFFQGDRELSLAALRILWYRRILGIPLVVLGGLCIITTLSEEVDLLAAVRRGILPAHMKEAR